MASSSHPSSSPLAHLLPKYPSSAGALLQTYNDLKLAQGWSDLELLDLPSCTRGALRGRRPNTEETLLVVPCSLAESLSVSWFAGAFEDLGRPESVYLAINAEDSNIVYYKLSPGIVKPAV